MVFQLLCEVLHSRFYESLDIRIDISNVIAVCIDFSNGFMIFLQTFGSRLGHCDSFLHSLISVY